MIKAIAIRTSGGKTEILATGSTGDCTSIARAAGLKIFPMGSATVQVFSSAEGCVFNDDGRKADYLRRQAGDPEPVKKVAAPAKKQAKGKK
jgi:hypothetical protein|tara:strand:+ start:61 stop:333 length:273 start_codon:yes stop_codon:yes gene_type:complete